MKKLDFDPERLIDDAIRSGLDSRFFDVDFTEVDIPKAANVIEWCLGTQFLSSTIFTKQAEVLVKLFADFCPACSDANYLANVPVADTSGMIEFQKKVQLLKHGICPKCKKNRIELWEVIPEELIAVWGQRSGKSVTVAAKAATYQMHRFLMLGNIAKYFGQDSSQQFDMVFVAITKQQAESSLWSKFKNSYDSAPWFKEYNALLDNKGKELGFELYKNLDTFVYYGGNKNLLATFKTSNLRTLRGDTRVFGSIDELGWFESGNDNKKSGKSKVLANADETYTSISNSLFTLRSVAKRKWAENDYNCPTALMCNVSSPSSKWDPIMRKLREGARDKSKVCSHLATWEVNPGIKKEDFKNEEISNPVKFYRDFGAAPPLGADAFIGNNKNVERIYDIEREPLFKYTYVTIGDHVAGSTGKYVAAKIIESTMKADKFTPRIVCVDAGETNNSFAVGVYHLEVAKDGIQKTIAIDQVIEVMPDQTSGEVIPVHFPTMIELILQIVAKYNVVYVVWDRWQSTGEVQRLRDLGVASERYSPRIEDFLQLRSMILSNNCKGPLPEVSNLEDLDLSNYFDVQSKPWAHFYLQVATVQEIGQKITKPLIGEDDMFRTFVLASCYLLDETEGKIFHSMGSTLNKSDLRGRAGGGALSMSFGMTNKSGNMQNRSGTRNNGRTGVVLKRRS